MLKWKTQNLQHQKKISKKKLLCKSPKSVVKKIRKKVKSNDKNNWLLILNDDNRDRLNNYFLNL